MAVSFFTAICLLESGKGKTFNNSNGMYTVFNGALQPFCKDIHLSVHVLHFDFVLNV